ncbi:DUF502 domain-containing protein [Solemya velum gill symbiont]|uniref:DUF502 domain-containing protein n=1 Tax=Solemya velum gill symbiont TaxID=2340 RepID=A0A0B0H7K4_SOVGS|nr:DUF502 domain-containing protein [Solemya velum gill symbiont]KHF25100.1 hypothetical protein JV46_09570 [Solemya velum gill symbiont]OOY34830.1 hypothetical protein BOV88_07820 [Solemya velum gill symbiont]OOY37545.1 hypothetical protein BOV89_06655 [Solemya velum gill symbiont]OOY40166.1 hypothetical protein BOV90_05505 [Solemya velum gill symbiont]OOY44843.1 hypothetical protein BOV91_00185 [Solemya velum gill symbiont]
MKFLSRNILTGFITIIPVTLTLYLLYWLIVSVETVLGDLIKLALPSGLYWPGMGVIAGLFLFFAVGLLMHAYVVRRLFAMSEQILYRMPVIKSIYRSIRDFFDYFSPKEKDEFEQVVAITIGDTDMQIIGFVTQDNPDHIPEGLRQDDHVLVYLPMSYMIGGYAVLVPRNSIRPLDLNMEEAMRFALTAGVTGAVNTPHETEEGVGK